MIEGVRNFVSPRAESLVDAACQIGSLPGATLKALLYTASDLVSLGKNNHFTIQAKDAQGNMGSCVWELSLKMIDIINPHAQSENWNLSGVNIMSANRLMSDRTELDGLPSHVAKLAMKQQEILARLYEGNRFEKHVETRLFSLVSGALLAITGVALTVFGAAATVAAMATCGSYKKVNSYAINNIRAIGFALNRLHQGVLGAFNPSCVVNSSELVSDSSDDETESMDDQLFLDRGAEEGLQEVEEVRTGLLVVERSRADQFEISDDDDDDDIESRDALLSSSVHTQRHPRMKDEETQRNNFVAYRVLSGATALAAGVATYRWMRA